MKRISFKNAYFIRLGHKSKWADSAIREHKLRMGWDRRKIADINGHNWALIGRQLLAQHQYDKGAAKRDLEALKKICLSTPEDIWITFHDSCLWWCRMGSQHIHDDSVSRYRSLDGHWSCTDVNGNRLLIDRIPGSLAKTQRFSGTACDVRERETLLRLINDQESPSCQRVKRARDQLARSVADTLSLLTWKDFETLVDLVFRASGWQRVSMVGKSQKFTDMDLRDPITERMYQVQVKAAAGWKEFDSYRKHFNPANYDRLYFVVHSPSDKLRDTRRTRFDHVYLWRAEELASMVVNVGLVPWLLAKIR